MQLKTKLKHLAKLGGKAILVECQFEIGHSSRISHGLSIEFHFSRKHTADVVTMRGLFEASQRTVLNVQGAEATITGRWDGLDSWNRNQETTFVNQELLELQSTRSASSWSKSMSAWAGREKKAPVWFSFRCTKENVAGSARSVGIWSWEDKDDNGFDEVFHLSFEKRLAFPSFI